MLYDQHFGCCYATSRLRRYYHCSCFPDAYPLGAIEPHLAAPMVSAANSPQHGPSDGNANNTFAMRSAARTPASFAAQPVAPTDDIFVLAFYAMGPLEDPTIPIMPPLDEDSDQSIALRSAIALICSKGAGSCLVPNKQNPMSPLPASDSTPGSATP